MLKKIYYEEGLGAFMKGINFSLILVSNPVIQFIIYEQLKKRMLSEDGSIASAHVVWISLVSKLITTLCTYPLFTIKTMLQCNSEKNSDHIWSMLGKLYEVEGILGFYKGKIITKELRLRLFKPC